MGRHCGSPATALDPLHVHHVVPRSKGGTGTLSKSRQALRLVPSAGGAIRFTRAPNISGMRRV